jgi:hypothetical protein
MKRVLAVGFVGLVLASAGGCGNNPDGLMKKQIANMNALADSWEKGEPADRQQAILERIKATNERMEKLKLTEDQKKELGKKYDAELGQVMQRLFQAMMKQAGTNPGAMAGLDLKSMFK